MLRYVTLQVARIWKVDPESPPGSGDTTVWQNSEVNTEDPTDLKKSCVFLLPAHHNSVFVTDTFASDLLVGFAILICLNIEPVVTTLMHEVILHKVIYGLAIAQQTR